MENLNQSKTSQQLEQNPNLFKYNSVKTILHKHQSITFASIFKSQSVFKNQSTDPSSELIDSGVIAYNKTDSTSCNNDNDFTDNINEKSNNTKFSTNNLNISKSKSIESYKRLLSFNFII